MKIAINRLMAKMAVRECTFTALADASGVSRTTLSYIKNGKTCRPDVAGKLAKALGVDVEEILEQGGERE